MNQRIQRPNPALNPVRFALWTLRDKAAQRRLALRWASQKMMRTLVLMTVGLVVWCSASAEQFDTIVGQCWEGKSHPQMSACVRLRASQARAALRSAEREVREAIAKSNAPEFEPEYVKAVSDAFEANVRSFRQYRKDQCRFIFTLASVGNGPDDNKLACEAELDISRVEQLGKASWWLKQ